ncbi:MAG: nucleotidyltransferase family protein [Candidatus Hydrogenedentes bacterium]|nr:nucleotidyltransferase family protein [Candidatus Hydrogenedentota bacterium]
MISAIVLAAGESRRMGTQKLLLPFGGKTVIAHVVDNVLGSDVGRTVLVTGSDHAAIIDALSGRQILVARNERYCDGMLSSIRRGIAEAGEDVEAYLVVLGDQPNISPITINALLNYAASAKSEIVIPTFGEKPGHPIVVPARFRGAIMTKYDGVGLRGLLHEYAGCVTYCPVETDAVLFDMDTEAGYKHALARLAEIPVKTD